MRWWRISKMEKHTTCNTSFSTWPVLRLPSLYSNANSHSQVGSKGKFLFQVWQRLFLSPSKNMEISIHSCIMIKLLIKKKPTRLLKYLINCHNLQALLLHQCGLSPQPEELTKIKSMQKPSVGSQQDLSQ